MSPIAKRASLFVLLLFPLHASCQVLPNLTPAFLKDDPRLSAKVTISARNKSVGELLAELSKKTGIKLSAREDDGGALEQVAVFAKDTPLSKILNGLWSTFSFQGGMWEWRRLRDRDQFKYVLEQPDSAKRLRQSLRDAAYKRLEDGVENLIKALDADEKTRDAALREVNGDWYLVQTDKAAKTQFWADVRSMAKLFPPEDRRAIYRRESRLVARLDALTLEEQQPYLDEYARARLRSRAPLLPPESVHLTSKITRGLPTVTLIVPKVTVGSVFGGLPHMIGRFAREFTEKWMLPGESSASPLDEARVRLSEIKLPPPAEEERNPEVTPFATVSFERMRTTFERIAVATGAPIIVRIPQDAYRDSLLENVRSLKELWAQLDRVDLRVKWTDGVLVACNYSWPMEDPPLPSDLAPRLARASLPGQMIPFEEIVYVASNYSPRQIERLRLQFDHLSNLGPASGWLRMFGAVPEVVRQASAPAGVELTSDLRLRLSDYLPVQLHRFLRNQVADRIKIFSEYRPGPRSSRVTRLTLLAKDGAPIQTLEFIDTAVMEP